MPDNNVISRGQLVLNKIEGIREGETPEEFAVRAVDAQAAQMVWALIDFQDEYRQRADRQVEIIQDTVVTPLERHTREAVKKLHREIVQRLITDANKAGVRRVGSLEAEVPVEEPTVIEESSRATFNVDESAFAKGEPWLVTERIDDPVPAGVTEPFEADMGPPRPGEM